MGDTPAIFEGISLEKWEEFIQLEEMEEDEDALTVALTPHVLQIITFYLGTELYGIDILKVKELINYAPCTIIPNMPHFIKGMVNLRGLVIPVMDLRLRFGVGEATYHRYTVIMVVQVEGRLSGLIVDAVADVLAVPHETVQPPPDHLSPLDISFIAGVVKVRGNMVILLNPERLLAKEVLLMSSPLAEEETP